MTRNMTNDESFHEIFSFLIAHENEIPVDSELGQAFLRAAIALQVATDSAVNIVIDTYNNFEGIWNGKINA